MEATHRLSRRAFTKLLGGAAAVAAIPLMRLTDEASAGRTWCRYDPVVKIDGKVADIWLGSYTDLNTAATGPAKIVVSVPAGTPAELLATDLGFGKHGYDVRFVEDSTLRKSWSGPQVRVQVYVPSRDGTLPLTVNFAPRSSGLAPASAFGRVNSWVKLTTR